MKPETLESLMIDRALNELPPEVAELLDAYVAQNPAVEAAAAQLGEAVKLAHQAVAVPNDAPHSGLVPNLRPGLRRESWLNWFRVPRIELARLAAGLALGLALGWMLPSMWRTSEVGQTPSSVRYMMADARPATVRNTAPEFWSLAAVVAQRQARTEASRPVARNLLPWDSLFQPHRTEKSQ
jgi:anti-sigma factor RsiW